MKAELLEMPGYAIYEVENILSMPVKTGYKLVKDGKVKAYRDSGGKLRISYGELYRYMKDLESK